LNLLPQMGAVSTSKSAMITSSFGSRVNFQNTYGLRSRRFAWPFHTIIAN
jgi:hypothetical protein